MSKVLRVAERVVVTFFEAALAYYVAVGSPKLNKALVVGAVGAGVSAIYNLVRESPPTLSNTPPVSPPPVAAPPAAPVV